MHSFLVQWAPMVVWCPLAYKWAVRTHSVCPVRRKQTAKMAINKVGMVGGAAAPPPRFILCSCCLDRVTEVRSQQETRVNLNELACLLHRLDEIS